MVTITYTFLTHHWLGLFFFHYGLNSSSQYHELREICRAQLTFCSGISFKCSLDSARPCLQKAQPPWRVGSDHRPASPGLSAANCHSSATVHYVVGKFPPVYCISSPQVPSHPLSCSPASKHKAHISMNK